MRVSTLKGLKRYSANKETKRCKSSCDAQGADFRGLVLFRLNLAGADLSGCSFSGATIIECTFDKASLAGADLSNTIFSKSSFCGADLRGADFRGTVLKDIAFGGGGELGPLAGVGNYVYLGACLSFGGAQWGEPVLFDDSILNAAAPDEFKDAIRAELSRREDSDLLACIPLGRPTERGGL